MNVRILPFEEWPRVDTSGMPLLPHVDPRNSALVVVEKDGKIVARLGVYSITAFEGLWIDPDSRKNPGVIRALLRQAAAIARERGELWAYGSAQSDEMKGVMSRLGTKVQADMYALWVGGN